MKNCCKNPACKCKCKSKCKENTSTEKQEVKSVTEKKSISKNVSNKVKIGINGFGRIGRTVLKCCLQRGLEVCSINETNMDVEYMAYNFKYDSSQGRCPFDISSSKDGMMIDGKLIRTFSEKNPKQIDWSDVTVVIESSGFNTTISEASNHLRDANGPTKVIITGFSEDAPCIVMGCNLDAYKADTMHVISCGSSIINCVAPIVKILNSEYGSIEGIFTSIQPYCANQYVVDGTSKSSWRQGRSAGRNIIPISIEHENEMSKVIPDLAEKIKGISFGAPTLSGAILDLTFRTQNPTKYDTVIEMLKEKAKTLNGIIDVTDEAIVSKDIKNCAYSALIDKEAGMALNDNFMKIIAWYDNEFGYSSRVIDIIQHIS